jgi:hypothetical protein
MNYKKQSSSPSRSSSVGMGYRDQPELVIWGTRFAMFERFQQAKGNETTTMVIRVPTNMVFFFFSGGVAAISSSASSKPPFERPMSLVCHPCWWPWAAYQVGKDLHF